MISFFFLILSPISISNGIVPNILSIQYTCKLFSKFRYEFGNSNIGAQVWIIGRLAKPSIAYKDISIFSIIIMSLPVGNHNNLVDSKSSKLRIYYIKSQHDALSPSLSGSE